jgi:glycerol-3-phosphate dehydrogenase (NAD(P)+)
MPVSGSAAVIGAGSWGTALAVHLAGAGREVALWVREPELLDEMNARRANPTFLPDVTFPSSLRATGSFEDALAGVRFVVLAVPSHYLRGVVVRARSAVPPDAILVSATKGIEQGTWRRMTEVIAEEMPDAGAVVALSGPSFAAEVARQCPTALVAASPDADAVAAVQEEFRSPYFRLYASDDVIGVELGAALKNVIAIGAGVVESMHLGHNAMSALITRGLAEMSRLVVAMGGRRETLAGLSGLGDLVLTCTGSLSRNRHVGIELGRGRSLHDILAGMKMIAEGVNTTAAALALGEKYGVELPIMFEMAEVLAGRHTPHQAIGCLMGRPQRGEWGDA